MKGKHDDLPTDVLILYARSGFTKGAKEKAGTYRKRIVALETVDEDSVGLLFNGVSSLGGKSSNLTVTKVRFGLAANASLPDEQIDVFTDTLIFNQSSQAIAVAENLVNQFLHSPKVILTSLQTGQDHHKNFTLAVQAPATAVGDRIYLLKTDQNPPVLRLVESITISGDAAVKTFRLPLKHGKLEDTVVAWGPVQHEGKQALVVASRDESGVTKVSFDTGERTVELQNSSTAS